MSQGQCPWNRYAPCLGIRLGVTTCTVAAWDGAKACPLESFKDSTARIPCALARTATGDPLVGLSAIRQSDRYRTEWRALLHIRESLKDNESVTLLLKRLMLVAREDHFRTSAVGECVMAVPTGLDAEATRCVRESAEKSAIRLLRVVSRFEAASAGVAATAKEAVGRTMVVHIGGAYTECGVIGAGPPLCETLGGDNVDKAILDSILQGCVIDADIYAQALAPCRTMKEALSRMDKATAPANALRSLGKPIITMTRTQMESLIDPLLVHLSEIITKCLVSSSLDASAIGRVVLCGGSVLMPCVQAAVRRLFPQAELSLDPTSQLVLEGCVRLCSNLSVDILYSSFPRDTMKDVLFPPSRRRVSRGVPSSSCVCFSVLCEDTILSELARIGEDPTCTTDFPVRRSLLLRRVKDKPSVRVRLYVSRGSSMSPQCLGVCSLEGVWAMLVVVDLTVRSLDPMSYSVEMYEWGSAAGASTWSAAGATTDRSPDRPYGAVLYTPSRATLSAGIVQIKQIKVGLGAYTPSL